MSMPGFTAETSIYKTSGHYHTDRHAINSSTHMIRAIYSAAKGQDFPDSTCTCQKCGPKGGDVTGNCASVCKDKTVFSKGSEPHDYCKAAKVRPPRDFSWYVPGDSVAFSR